MGRPLASGIHFTRFRAHHALTAATLRVPTFWARVSKSMITATRFYDPAPDAQASGPSHAIHPPHGVIAMAWPDQPRGLLCRRLGIALGALTISDSESMASVSGASIRTALRHLLK